jgi:hypothetical protein
MSDNYLRSSTRLLGVGNIMFKCSEGYAYDGFGRLSGTSSFSGTSTTAGTVNVEDGNPVYINQFTTINGHA